MLTKAKSVKRTSVLAAVALMAGGLAVSGASAMPAGPDAGASAAATSPMLLRVSVGQHRIIPGEAPNAPHPQHAERKAPDLYCDKQEAKCQ